jgi:hypothetical protein
MSVPEILTPRTVLPFWLDAEIGASGICSQKGDTFSCGNRKENYGDENGTGLDEKTIFYEKSDYRTGFWLD